MQPHTFNRNRRDVRVISMISDSSGMMFLTLHEMQTGYLKIRRGNAAFLSEKYTFPRSRGTRTILTENYSRMNVGGAGDEQLGRRTHPSARTRRWTGWIRRTTFRGWDAFERKVGRSVEVARHWVATGESRRTGGTTAENCRSAV